MLVQDVPGQEPASWRLQAVSSQAAGLQVIRTTSVALVNVLPAQFALA